MRGAVWRYLGLAHLDHGMQEVAGKAVFSFAYRLIGALAQFAFVVLVTRLFGPTGLGSYALVQSVVIVASTVGRWGIDQAALKYVAIAANAGEAAGVKRIVSQAQLLVTAFSLIITLLVWLAAPWLGDNFFHSSDFVGLLRLMALSIVPFSLLNLLAEAIRGLRRIGPYTLLQGVAVPLLSILFLLAFLSGSGPSLQSAAAAYVVACVCAMLLGFLLWRLYLGGFRQKALDPGADSGIGPRQLLATANQMAWVTMIAVAMGYAETIILGVFRSEAEVGLFSAALRFSLLPNFVIIAFNSILAPKIAALYHGGDFAAVRFLARRTVKLMLLVTAPIFALYFALPHFLLGLFGRQFGAAAAVLMILSLGQLLIIAAGPVEVLLMMTGHEKLMRRNQIVAAFCGLFFGGLLIYRFGAVGAAWASVIRSLAVNGLSLWDVRREIYSRVNLEA
ncbi:MAG: oligosaccharide flippase family protein [Desulfobulbaceae bacterium]|nr:oligosaccharide flippase family protein [Desulfobulbaceae bacterium]